MEFRVLGVVEALEHGLPISLGGPKQKSLLAMLLLDPNHVVSTDHLVDGLWGDEPPQRAAATIHVYVSKLRKAIEPDRSPRSEPTRLLTQPPGYLLAIDPDDVDLFRFEAMVDGARALWGDGCVVGAAVLFGEALALWREAPLADLADEPFARFEVARLEEARTGAIEDRIDADLALGRAVELIPELEALVARNPYRERLHRQLMLALYRAGQQADALAAYQRARAGLVDDLGLEPGRELREMESAILVQEPDLAWTEPRPITADEVARVLRTANRAEPDVDVVSVVTDDARESAHRAEDALRRAIDREHTNRLSATVEAAGETRVQLDRVRRVIADGVLDRRSRRSPSLGRSAARSGVTIGACPYKGLLRFEPEDAEWYFGRERLVAEVLAAVASTRGVGVVGASGSGKSSLTRAGLIAALRDDALPGSAAWPRLLVTPGSDPMLELARAMAPVAHAASVDHVRDQLLDDPESIAGFARRAIDGRAGDASVMIVVDQLEEVFTVCRDDELRARFLDVLVHAAADHDSPTRVLAAIRSDYYGQCADHADFADLVGRGNVLVGPMRPDELQRAIEEPALGAGLVLEDGLVDRIFEDIGTEPGSLPLLETALLETWTRRAGNVLTLDGYMASGGVRGAVAHLAEDVYGRMSGPQRDIVRGIFLRLAEPGAGTDDVRRRAPLDELLVDDEHAHVLGTLVEHRLVVTSDVTAEVSHEALLREWPRLRDWLEEDREGRRVHRALAVAAQDWISADRNNDLLFRGTRLGAALDVADAHPAEINPVERDFLGASRAYQDVELRSAQRTAHRLRRLTVGMALILVIALFAGVFSVVQRSRANDNADRAEQQTTIAEAQRISAEARAQANRKYDLALLLALEARRVHPSADANGALKDVLLAAPPRSARVVDFGARKTWVKDPNALGLTLVTLNDETMAVFDPGTGQYVRKLRGIDDGSSSLSTVSADGRWAASSGNSGVVTVWNVRTGRLVDRFDTGIPRRAYTLFDPSESSRLFVAAHNGRVVLMDLQRPSDEPVDLSRAPGSPINEFPTLLRISSDGAQLAASSPAGGPTHVFDARTGVQRLILPGTVGGFSADGAVVLTSSSAGVQRWSTSTGAPIGAPMTGLENPAPLALFSPNQRYVAVGNLADEHVYVFDLLTGGPAFMSVDSSRNNNIALPSWRRDGHLAVIGDSTAIVVDVDPDRLSPISTRVEASGTGTLAIPSDRDDRFVILDRGTNLINAETGSVEERLPRPAVDPNWLVVPTSDGRFQASSPFATANPPNSNSPIQVYAAGRAEPLGAITKDPEDPPGWYWASDDRTLVVPHRKTVDLWRASEGSLDRSLSLRPVGPYAPPPAATSVDFSPDGRTVVVGREDAGTATFFDVASGRRTAVFRLGKGLKLSALAYNPGGHTLAIAATPTPRAERSSILMLDTEQLKVRARSELPALADAIVFAPNGEWFLTKESNDPEVGIWDAATLGPVGYSFTPQSPGVNNMVFSPDGRWLAIATFTGAIIYDVDPTSWVERACSIAGRTLTRGEWKRYLPDRPYDPACRS